MAKRNNNNAKRQKEVELNVDAKDLNKADLKDSKSKDTKPTGHNRNRRSNRSNNDASRNREARDNDRKRGANDPIFYNKIPGLVDSSSKIMSTKPLGFELGLSRDSTILEKYRTIPGIMQIDYTPVLGFSDSVLSPANQAILDIYMYIQSTVSVNLPFEVPELGMYLMAWDSLYVLMNAATRLYYSMNYSDKLNDYTPQAVILAEGFDYADFVAHKAEFLFWLNDMRVKMNKYYIPGGYDFMTKHSLLAANIYVDDGESAKSQYFVFRPISFYEYIETDANNPAYLSLFEPYSTYNTDTLTFEQLKSIFDNMFVKLVQSQDFQFINSYLLRAFGTANAMVFGPIDSLASIMPTYRMEVLQQINNMVILPGFTINSTSSSTWAESWYIKQGELDTGLKSGALIQTCIVPYGISSPSATNKRNAKCYCNNRMFNVAKSDYSSNNVLEASRLMWIGDHVDEDSEAELIISKQYGTELVRKVSVIVINKSNTAVDAQWVPERVPALPSYSFLSANGNNASFIRTWSLTASFDWGPSFTIGENAANSTTELYLNTNEFRDYAIMTKEQLNDLHIASVMSEYLNQTLLKGVKGNLNK